MKRKKSLSDDVITQAQKEIYYSFFFLNSVVLFLAVHVVHCFFNWLSSRFPNVVSISNANV